MIAEYHNTPNLFIFASEVETFWMLTQQELVLSASRIFFSRLTKDDSSRTTLLMVCQEKIVVQTLMPSRLIVDPKTRRHKGFGFVMFETEIEAQKAVKAHDARHHGSDNMHHLLLDKFPKNADSAQAILRVL